MKKHPSAIAWQKWIGDEANASIRKANLTAYKLNDQYMENRLYHAFMAGWAAGKGDTDR